MCDGMAQTIAQAEAQSFALPEFSRWREFAGLLDGYKIAEEMGGNLRDWGAKQEAVYLRTGSWALTVLELRLMLFYEFRADYFTGYDYTERDEIVDSLLSALSLKTGQPYTPLQRD